MKVFAEYDNDKGEIIIKGDGIADKYGSMTKTPREVIRNEWGK